VSLDGLAMKRRIEDVLYQAVNQGIQSVDQIDGFLASLPFSDTMSFGGNTSCVELDNRGEYMFCDMGSGLREFSEFLQCNPTAQRSQTFNFFISHTHWDHIMGFPFFTAAYTPGTKINIYGCHDDLEEAIRNQHLRPNFPVSFDMLAADIEFHVFKPGEVIDVNGYQIESFLQHHEGDSYGYRFTKDKSSVVYSTDSEHKVEAQAELDRFVRFIKDADLVIFDAMYSLLDSVTLKEDWGHSSNLMGVELCLRAGARKLCLFHHDPAHSDEEIYRNLEEAISFAQLIGQEHDSDLEVVSAWDGLILPIN